MQQLEQAADAIRSRDWPRALARVLDAWRQARLPELADLVDRVGAECTIPAPPRDRRALHAWWMQHAVPYDPAAVSLLADHASKRLRNSEVSHATVAARWSGHAQLRTAELLGPGDETDRAWNWIDRLAAIQSWPADPRIARRLAQWLTTPGLLPGYGAQRASGLDAIAERLVTIGDVRVLARLADAERELSRYSDVVSRTDRERIAALRATLENRLPAAPPALAAQVRELLALVRAQVRVDLEHLWRQVAEHPGDSAPRSVLADALAARQDTRGELIALQLSLAEAPATGDRDRRLRRAARIVDNEWERWLDDVALLAVPSHCELRRGMLEVLVAGHSHTPAWAWTAVHGHRELACVHTVRPLHVVHVDGYARFVAALASLRTLAVDTPRVVDALAELDVRLPITTLEYSHVPASSSRPQQIEGTLASRFGHLARLAPQLEVLRVDARRIEAELTSLVPRLPAMLPRVQRVLLSHTFATDRATLTRQFGAYSFVSIEP